MNTNKAIKLLNLVFLRRSYLDLYRADLFFRRENLNVSFQPTPRSRVLHKLRVYSVKKFTAFYRTRRSTAVSTPPNPLQNPQVHCRVHTIKPFTEPPGPLPCPHHQTLYRTPRSTAVSTPSNPLQDPQVHRRVHTIKPFLEPEGPPPCPHHQTSSP
jgi:hypothetical protein